MAMATELRDARALVDLYKSDFYAWARHQAEALRAFQATRPNLPLDLEHLIEEVDGLADTKLSAIKSQLSRIMVHYLKLEFSPASPPRRKWEVSIIDAQNQIDSDMTPSLRPEAEQSLARVYNGARRLAAAELRAHDEPEAARALPATCPYTLDQLLDETWRPTNRHGLADEPL
jgi:hypothetical protein